MEANDDLENRIENFASIVREEFSFLVDGYGFAKNELEKLDFEYPKDKHVRIDYISDFLCVRITWYLIDATIGVGLIELVNGRIPDRYSYWEKEGFSRAIGLSTLVEFLTDGEVKGPLPDVGAKISAGAITKAWRERGRLIDQDMKGILATYSNWLRTYASDILAGDNSVFERVQKYAKEKIAEAYYL